MSGFDIGSFMSSLGTPDVGATTDYDYGFDPADYRQDPVDFDFSKVSDPDGFMGIFDVGDLGDSYSGSGINLDFLTDPDSYSGNFDDQGFNIDFLDDIFGTDGGFSDPIFSDTSNLEALLAAAQEGSEGDKPNAFQNLLGAFLPQSQGSGGAGGLLELLGPLAISSFLKDRGYTAPKIPSNAYEGSIPEYTAVREQVTGRDDTDRRPGSGGRRYFSDTIYAKKPEGQKPMSVEEARAAAKAQAQAQAQAQATPGNFDEEVDDSNFVFTYGKDRLGMPVISASPPENFAGGGHVLEDGGYLQGASDGQADLVPGDIDGVQEARLSHGEYVLPADLVAILGNGNSDAGAAALDDFMSTVRKKATGTPKQQKNIDADQVLTMLSKRMS